MRLSLLAALALTSLASTAAQGSVRLEFGGRLQTLPVTGGEVRRASAELRHDRVLRLAGRRLKAPRTRLDARGLRVSALWRGSRIVFLVARGAPVLDRVSQQVRLGWTPVRLSSAGARRLATRLAPGRVAVAARLPGAEPPIPARPPGAVDVRSAAVTWRVRDSFVRYIASGEGTSVSRGATHEPPTTTPESDVPLVYEFHFPFRDGWRDPASGRAFLRFGGRVTFSYSAHGIDLDVNDLELHVNGSRSVAVARFTGRRDTRPGNRRGVLVELDSSGGLGQMPGSIPAQTAGAIFAGYYLAGEPFGWIGAAIGGD